MADVPEAIPVTRDPASALSDPVHPLDRSLASGVAWIGAARFAAQLFSWIVTIGVVRRLAPSDYGIVGMGSLYLGLLMIAAEFGLGTAVVAHRDLTETTQAGLNTIAAGLGVAGFLVSLVSAYPLSLFFHSPELRVVVPVLSVNFLLIAARTVPQGLLQKDLRFRDLALIELLQSVLMACAAFAMAILGFRYWALVLGALIGSFVSALLTVLRRPVPFGRPDAGTTRSLRLSRDILGTRLAWYASENVDLAVVGRLFGEYALGAYTIGRTIALLPLEKVNNVTMSVTPSIFSASRHDPALVRRYLLVITSAILLVTLPATIGIAIVAPDLVHVVLGARWQLSVVPLQVLAAYAAVRSLDPLWTQLLTVTDDASFVLRQNVIGMFVLPVAFVAGSHWGLVGVATAWLIVHPLVIVLPLFFRISDRFGVTARDHVSSMLPSLTSGLVMATSMLLVRASSASTMPPRERLVITVSLGTCVYFAMLALFFRREVTGIVRSVRLLRRSSSSER